MKNLIQTELSGQFIIISLTIMIVSLLLITYFLKMYQNILLKNLKVKSSENQIETRVKYSEVNENRYRTSFYLVGIVVSLFVAFLFINWTQPVKHADFNVSLENVDEIITEKEIPRTAERQRVKMPPTSKMVNILNDVEIVEDDFENYILNESTDLSPIINPDSKVEGPKVVPIIEMPLTVKMEENIFKIVEQMPRFPGCEDVKGDTKVKEDCAKEKLLQYLSKTVKYPVIARENGIEGQAVIQFTVGKSGEIEDVIVLRDPGAGLGDAAKEAVETMNKMTEKWIPGRQRGVPVKVQYTVPLKFKLNN